MSQINQGKSSPPTRDRRDNSQIPILFDPTKPDVELFDKLAEQQADAMPGDRDSINSNQLRKYFSEIKDLFRQFQANGETSEFYIKSIEPRFKMIRSKVAYGSRQGGQGKLPKQFADMITVGIGKVRSGNKEDFTKFVMHLEAVVGFMYGNGKVSK